MRPWALVLLAMASVLWAGPVCAQSAYVAGAIGAEMIKTTTVKSGGSTFDNGSGDALAGAIRVGAFIAPRFGVELEFFRPGTIDTDFSNGPVYPVDFIGSASSVSWSSQTITSGGVSSDLYSVVAPSFLSQKTRVRTTTTSALVFARQSLGSRVDLVYLGGIGFSRVVRDVEYGFPQLLTPLIRPIARSYSSRTTQYGAGPVVGVEGRIAMTEHARLVAGVRLHTVGQSLVDGWLVRPSVGLAWMF
jgi:hypothetical protein